MENKGKEKILVSSCLLGLNCKYDGGNNYSNEIDEFLKDYDVIPICPEIMGGLPTPRVGSERLGDKVITKDEEMLQNNIKKVQKELFS